MKRSRRHPVRRLILIILIVAASILLLRWGRTCFLKRMYPRTYSSIVEQEARKDNLDPYLVYAVIRQESNFNADAKSSAGAIGLMQLTPDTFEWLQRKDKRDIPLPKDDLYNPEINIRYGCRFLAYLTKKYEIRRTALCAYNAGVSRVDSWLKDRNTSKDGKNLDVIPYSETRKYAANVEQIYRQYQELYDSK
jgi:soluble lytic murein transglycosylase